MLAASMDGTTGDSGFSLRKKRLRASETVYRVVVRNLVLRFRIGIHGHERHTPQQVRINLELTVARPPSFKRYADVLDYERIMNGIRGLAERDHVFLVEALAEDILELCLADPRVTAARIGVEKLEPYPEADGVGVVLEHRRQKPLSRLRERKGPTRRVGR
jgi:dihydroneopterin aldolase